MFFPHTCPTCRTVGGHKLNCPQHKLELTMLNGLLPGRVSPHSPRPASVRLQEFKPTPPVSPAAPKAVLAALCRHCCQPLVFNPSRQCGHCGFQY